MLPEDLVAWYAAHGYQFLGLSDHNIVLNGEHWMLAADLRARAGQRAAERCSEASGSASATIRVRDGQQECRLKTIVELGRQFEQKERFLLLSDEEVTSEAAKTPVHLTAVNVGHTVAPAGEGTVALALQESLVHIDAEARAQGQPAIGVINHPNFAWAIGADDLARVRTAQFVEVFNGHPFTASRGDIGKRPVTRLWDMSNAERVLERGWPPLFGVAGDDVHTLQGATEPSPGRGWIMVRAASLKASDLIDAMRQGDFYASTGVRLSRLDYDPNHQVVSLAIDPDTDTTYVTEFIATKAIACPTDSAKPADRWDSPQVGVVVARETALQARYKLADDDAFVRATVTASRPPNNRIESSYQGDRLQYKQAFTQPVGWLQFMSRRPGERQPVAKRCPVAKIAE